MPQPRLTPKRLIGLYLTPTQLIDLYRIPTQLIHPAAQIQNPETS